MFYRRLECISRQEICSAVKEYCKEKGIDGDTESVNLGGCSLYEVLEEISERLIKYAAQKEKEEFKTAQKRGIEEARKNGVVLGRPKKDIPQAFEKVYKAYRAGTISAGECAKILEINPSSFSYMIKKYENQNAKSE